jgi:hypothetical protein
MAERYVRVIPFSEHCPFENNRVHTGQEWHSFRNALLDILSPYGSVGPSGKLPILDMYEESTNEWQVATAKPDFFVVDDDM